MFGKKFRGPARPPTDTHRLVGSVRVGPKVGVGYECVCVCVRERERERTSQGLLVPHPATKCLSPL